MVSQEQFEELRVRLVAYESQQAQSQIEMQQEVKNQVNEVSEGLKELYTVANVAVGAVATRVQKIEEELAAQEEKRRRRGGEDKMQGQRSLLHYKNMKVPVLEKMEGWRNWLHRRAVEEKECRARGACCTTRTLQCQFLIRWMGGDLGLLM